MLDENPVLKFKNISKQFGDKVILKDLNLDIYKNQIMLIVGKSGCGKSTLFKILLGFYKPDSGFIFYNSKNLAYDQIKMREIVGFVSQENSFYEKLTVRENIVFFSKLYGVKKEDLDSRIDTLLNIINLKSSQNILADNLSGGMKRRLEFAISMVHNPTLLVLDEPFTGLDIKLRDELWEVLKEIKNSGVTVIISTHQLAIAQKNADRVVFLHNKKIVKDVKIKLLDSNFNLEKVFYQVISK